MASPVAGLPDELAGHQVRQGAASPVLPNGPDYPRIVQAWLWLKKPTWFLDRCSRAYGDVFTMRLPFGLNMVHIGRPELVKAVFGGDNDVLRAGEANATILEPLVGPHSVLVLDGPEHLRQRKLILPAFHGDRMRSWDAAVREITRAEIARWPAGKPFALRPSMQSITLDVIVRVVFGVDESARRDELRRRIRTLSGLGRNPLLLFATRDRRLGPLSPWARFLRARDALDAALLAQIRQRRAAPDLEQRSDVLSQLLLARDDEGRAMTDDEVRDELVTLLFAGHETTATSLAWAFDLLLHHPRVLSRLVADLDGGASEYLDAAIMETLRIRPVVALVDRHVREDIRIGEHTIPAGAIACPNIYLAQRRADLYPDPAAFRPDRFVGQTPPAFGWFPFGGGIRRCLGASFATFEMRIVIPEVLRAVTLRPASRRPARVRREAVTFVPHDGARCVVTRGSVSPLQRREPLPPRRERGLPSQRLPRQLIRRAPCPPVPLPASRHGLRHPHRPAERGHPLTARCGLIVTHVHEPGRPRQRPHRRLRRILHVHEAAHVRIRRQFPARSPIRHQPAPRIPGPGPVQQPVPQHHPLRRLPHRTLQRGHPLYRPQAAPVRAQVQRHILGRRNLPGLVHPGDALRHHPPNPRRQRRIHQMPGPGPPHLGIGQEVPALQVGQLMHHHIGRRQTHRPAQPVSVKHITHHGRSPEPPQPVSIGGPPHQASHRMPPLHQRRHHPPPDNPGSPRQEDPHHGPGTRRSCPCSTSISPLLPRLVASPTCARCRRP